MDKAVWSLILAAGVGLLLGHIAADPQASAQTPPSLGGNPLAPAYQPAPGGRGSGEDLIALGFEQDGQPPQVVVVDPRTQSMAVYHIDRNSGEISLRGVRNVRWDLQMEEFNGVSPTPSEIRSLLQRR